MRHRKHLLVLASAMSFWACTSDSTTSKNSPEKEESKPTAEYAQATSTDDCTAPTSWFKTVNGKRHTPAPIEQGPKSPFSNNATVSNCDFHQWSWQKFLWLTNDHNGKPMFLNNLIQVNPNGEKTAQDQGVILTSKSQASGTSDILKTPGSPSTTVYYSIFMDESMYNTMVTYGPKAKAHPEQVKDIAFPIGALELKTSWIAASALKNPSDYYVTDGVIEGVSTKVALLGMHVVGVVENHPEFVWATFEHEKLTPNYNWDEATYNTDAPVTSDVDYPFFSKSATATVKNITSGNGIYTDVFAVYKYGVPVEKNAQNQKVFMSTSQDEPENIDNMSMINQSVKNQLQGVWNKYYYNGSIWIDTEGYDTEEQQIALLNSKGGNLWESNPAQGSQPADLTRGSVAAYNITMETYVQVGFSPESIHQTDVNDLVNCFFCHNTASNGNKSPLYFSHVFTGYVDHLSGLNKTEIKNKHVKEIVEQFLEREEKEL